MCCTRLAGNTGRKNYAKNSPSGHHRTNLSGCIFATKACRPIEVGKNLLNSSISSTCLHNMANFGPLTAEIGLPVWGTPAVTAATSLTGCQPNIAQCLAVSSAYTLCIHFRGLLPVTEFCPMQNSLYIQVLLSLILVALYCTALQ